MGCGASVGRSQVATTPKGSAAGNVISGERLPVAENAARATLGHADSRSSEGSRPPAAITLKSQSSGRLPSSGRPSGDLPRTTSGTVRSPSNHLGTASLGHAGAGLAPVRTVPASPPLPPAAQKRPSSNGLPRTQSGTAPRSASGRNNRPSDDLDLALSSIGPPRPGGSSPSPSPPPPGAAAGGLPPAAAQAAHSGLLQNGRLVLANHPGAPSSSIDPAATPTASTATVMLLGGARAPGGGGGAPGGSPLAQLAAAGCAGRERYTNESDLSVESSLVTVGGPTDEDDEDELEALFTLAAWKRYYGYNRKKGQDLLAYFWRKFNPKEYSCWCFSYRYHTHIQVAYQAENVVNGYCARLEDHGLLEQLFAQLYALYDFEAEQYSVVGFLLVQGQALPPALAALSSFDNFAYHKADTAATLVRQFVSALIIGRSPLNSLQLTFARDAL